MRGVEQIPWLYDALCALCEATGLARWRRWLVTGARGRVLDLGCGTGRNLPLLPAGARAVGLEPSWEALQRARRRAPARAAGGGKRRGPPVPRRGLRHGPERPRLLQRARSTPGPAGSPARAAAGRPAPDARARARRRAPGRPAFKICCSRPGRGSPAAAIRTARPSARSRPAGSGSTTRVGGRRAPCAASRRRRPSGEPPGWSRGLLPDVLPDTDPPSPHHRHSPRRKP